jgi:beta-glucosidase
VTVALAIAAGGAAAGAVTLHQGRAPAPARASAVYLDPSYFPQERAADLVSRLTLAEKASLMDS